MKTYQKKDESRAKTRGVSTEQPEANCSCNVYSNKLSLVLKLEPLETCTATVSSLLIVGCNNKSNVRAS